MTDFTYTIKAHPTTYAGVNFRSRLEATWAAFFDLCGWEWEYEPFDLEGWTPDFLLKGNTRCLIEVKPVDFSESPKEWWGLNAVALAKKYAPKAFDYESKFPAAKEGAVSPEIMILGNGPYYDPGYFAPWMMGVFVREIWGVMGSIPASFFGGSDRPLDYASCEGCFAYRMSGEYDGDHHLVHIKDDLPSRLWKEAQNKTRWKGHF